MFQYLCTLCSHYLYTVPATVAIGVHFQVKEYDELKQETRKQTAVLRQQLYVAEKGQKGLQEILDRELCKKVQINHQQQGIKKAIADANIRLQKIDCYIK
jgi:hypothetical protein